MNPEDSQWEDERMAALFAAVNKDPAQPDEQFLERLREQSTEVFAASAKGMGTIPPEQLPAPPGQLPTSGRRRRMFVLASRALAASAASAALAGALIWGWLAGGESAASFGKVLQEVAAAETLHLRVTQNGKTEDVWFRRPDHLRWQLGPGLYRIARGADSWLVDEAANQAKSSAVPGFSPGQPGLDLLGLLRLSADQGTQAARPQSMIERDGKEYRVYHTEASDKYGPIIVDALVDAGTNLLCSLEATQHAKDGPQPLGSIEVVAVNAPVDEDLFVVGETLTEDGRIGKVTDVQGVVMLKPMAGSRFTPVAGPMIVKPGDWVQTDLRGANAAALRLVPQTAVTLGPGSLVELAGPKTIHIHRGELKVAADKKTPIEIVGPKGETLTVADKQLYRVQDEKLVRLAQDPPWLRGFEGATSDESIGSLVANVDGRNVPLSVGYHKVTVDIRDQIARTVIEESFVNHTDTVLEGVFHFPLPQDASISGFGMWIGDNLVEADVVEKQRAREIYETILRERRDPGLLEWSGGNIFKARVFPIPAHAEKRIKISYTQVLPMQGDQFRYSYALRSELLRQHPLRELAIDVKVNSVVPLLSVSSPTHATRNQHTRHSGRVEFTAQEYTPARDFEVVVQAERAGSDVVLIPHRRGQDGYFMMLVSPPGAPDPSQRGLLPEGGPLDLLILADTSASMDRDARRNQAGLVAAILGALTSRDKFNLAACDVDCVWAFPERRPAEAANVQAAKKLLTDRASLGWTDLDKVLASALARCGPQTQLIYVGDGIVTTGDGDPVAFTNRLKRLYQGKTVTCHAVATGSSFEPGVLRAIAALGGGSFRQISGQQGPQAVALELLGEIARPTVRNLQVEFRGLRTARVYPEVLPNLAAGTQQILLGRYLPEGQDQRGEVIVTGRQGDKPVRLSAPVSLKDAEQGNSFIPRLWARMHLDRLLAQGPSTAIQDEVIGLSEEYHIITPYTSLLVLESDADRDRFKVKRRFQMRDGEKFFQEGRDTADYELVQQQMRRAGNWRLGLRSQVLRQLAALGRNARLFQPRHGAWPESTVLASSGRFLEFAADEAVGMAGDRSSSVIAGPEGEMLWDGQVGGADNDDALMFKRMSGPGKPSDDGYDARFTTTGEESEEEQSLKEITKDSKYEERDKEDVELAMPSEPWAETAPMRDGPMPASKPMPAEAALSAFDADLDMPVSRDWAAGTQLGRTSIRSSYDFDSLLDVSGEKAQFYAVGGMGGLGGGYGGRMAEWYWRDQLTSSLDTLFPHLPPVPAKEEKPDVQPPWPAEARALAQSLLRTGQLFEPKKNLHVDRWVKSFDPRRGEPTTQSHTSVLLSSKAWLAVSDGDAAQTTVQWCDAKERGIFSKAFGLGRLRASQPMDLARPPVTLDGYATAPLDASYRGYKVEVQPNGPDRVLLILTAGWQPPSQVRILIDTARHVVVQIENRQNDKVVSTQKFDKFVEVAGSWWAGRIETLDGQGRRSTLVEQQFRTPSDKEFAELRNAGLAQRDKVQFLRQPMPTIHEAKRALAAAKAGFDDRMTLLVYFAGSQQWARAMEHLGAADQLAPGKPGMTWVRDAVLAASRNREELRKRIMLTASRLAEPTVAADSDNSSQELFLANYLRGQAGQLLESNEMLALLDALRPIYARQPAYLHAMRQWTGARADCLENTSQVDQSLRLREQLAKDYPWDHGLQERYAQALVAAGEYEAAYSWLNRLLSGGARWEPGEESSLRGTYARFLRDQGRYAEVVEYLAAWVRRNPEDSWPSPYAQYLSALVCANRPDEAEKLMRQWLAEAQRPGRLPPDVSARLQAAVNQALGQGHDLWSDRIDPRWFAPLAEAALVFARHESEGSMADRIINDYRFQPSDECREVRRKAAAVVLAEMDKLPPDQLVRLTGWIVGDDPRVEPEAWKRIAAGLRKRWAAEKKPDARRQLAGALVRVLSARAPAADYLDFLRTQLKEAAEPYRSAAARQLFDAILVQPWSAGLENEAIGLLERISDAKEPVRRHFEHVAALHRLTDRMVAARAAAAMLKVEHQEKLTRTQLRDKKAEALKSAREGLADRLAAEIQRHEKPLRDWINIERLYLDVLAGRRLAQAEGECWELLGPPGTVPFTAPQKPTPPNDPSGGKGDGPVWSAALLRGRVLTTLANLAVRNEARPELAERLLKYLDQAAAAEPDHDGWKQFKYRLLVALDRPKDLEKALRAWIATDDEPNRWRVVLGYLAAEQGRIAEGIKEFEAVRAADELRPAECRALAGWYMAAGRREDWRRARIDAYKLMPERYLYNMLRAKYRPWERGEGVLPSQLDDEVLLVFAAVFEKSGSPQDYLWQLQRFYQATHDFRLLAGLADAVVGHTAGQVYPFLQNMRSVLEEIRDEATADSLVSRLAEVRKRAATDVDRRALDLLELQVERRAAEVLNQPGPHAERALAAMQRAFQRSWSAGEQRLVADLLAGLGTISQRPLSDEQLRELAVLHRQQPQGTLDRLHVADCLGRTLRGYQRYDEAVDLLETALNEHQAACGGVLPAAANSAVETLLGCIEQKRHFARGETLLLEQLKHPANRQQRFWLTGRLYQLYEAALREDGSVSLGSGQTLYGAVQQRLQDAMGTDDNNHRQVLAGRLCSFYRTAREKKVAGVADDLRKFAFTRLPEVLKRQTNGYASMVGQVADTVHHIVGPYEGLRFLVERIEQEPGWLRYRNEDGWSQHNWRLAEWRTKAGSLGELEPRLLAIVTAELRRDLESYRQRSRTMYDRHSGHFWKEKEDAFARTAEEVYAERKHSGRAVEYVAAYLAGSLEHYPRAIEMLLVAHGQRLLGESGQASLARYLHHERRYGESIAILGPMIERWPDNVEYRTLLLHAFFRTQRKEELLALLKRTDEYFHQGSRWQENVMAALAYSCLENELFEQSAAYYDEAISLHQRTAPRRGIGEGTLYSYYARSAEAWAGLKNTPKAVDAACGAIVSWGPRHDQRAGALETLKNVLQKSPNLDAYVAELDKQTAEKRADNPLVRKALGQVYAQRQEWDKAVAQFKAAALLQPNDTETHRALVDCYDKQGDKQGAVRQLLESVEISRRDIALYRELGQRLTALEQPAEAERAYTSIVEVLPSESESHTLLAEVRQEQDRWDEAVVQWEQVARIRALEPTGLLKLAAAEIHQRRWAEAAATLQKLRQRSWPERFGNVADQARQLERQLEQERGKK
jgi:Flp pilus assembly protein TadD